jgi:hypothetical protein
MPSPKTIPAHARAHEDDPLRALLARFIAASLVDNANVGLYHAAIGRYPAPVILCAYETARNLPAAVVKKSRGAYFMWLLDRLCPNPTASSPSPPAPAPPASPSSSPAEPSDAST